MRLFQKLFTAFLEATMLLMRFKTFGKLLPSSIEKLNKLAVSCEGDFSAAFGCCHESESATESSSLMGVVATGSLEVEP